MIFNWLKQKKREKDIAAFREVFEPSLGPAMLMHAFADLAAEYWKDVNAGKKSHPITTRRGSNVVQLWNDALIEGVGYLIKYSAPDPTVFVDPRHQVATMETIVRHYQAEHHLRQQITVPADGVWPVYDWLRKTAAQAGEKTFGGIDENSVYGYLIPALTTELPKWKAGVPSSGEVPRTALQIIVDDVEAKAKLLALTIQLGPDFMTMKKMMSDRISSEPSRREFNDMFATIMSAKNPDDYLRRRGGKP